MKITSKNFDICLNVMCKRVGCTKCPLVFETYECDYLEYDEETAKIVKTVLEENGLMEAVEEALALEKQKNRYKNHMMLELLRLYAKSESVRDRNVIRSEIERRWELFMNSLDDMTPEDDFAIYRIFITGDGE